MYGIDCKSYYKVRVHRYRPSNGRYGPRTNRYRWTSGRFYTPNHAVCGDGYVTTPATLSLVRTTEWHCFLLFRRLCSRFVSYVGQPSESPLRALTGSLLPLLRAHTHDDCANTRLLAPSADPCRQFPEIRDGVSPSNRQKPLSLLLPYYNHPTASRCIRGKYRDRVSHRYFR